MPLVIRAPKGSVPKVPKLPKPPKVKKFKSFVLSIHVPDADYAHELVATFRASDLPDALQIADHIAAKAKQ